MSETPTTDLMVKLAVVHVRGHTRVSNGKVVRVSGYTYVRRGILQEAHARGWDVESGGAFKGFPMGMMQVVPEEDMARASLRDNNGNEVYHVVAKDPGKAFTSIEEMAGHFTGLGRFPERKVSRRDLAAAAKAAFPHTSVEEVRELLRKAPRPVGPAKVRTRKGSYR
jgi:hypothetical protein